MEDTLAQDYAPGKKFTVSSFVDDIGLTKFSWAIFVILGVCNIFEGYDYMIVSYTVPSMQAAWGLSSVVTGSLSSWSLIGLVLGGVIAGPVADAFGRKKALAIMTLIYGILNLPLYFSENWVFFAFFRVAAGTGLGATIPMVTTSFSEWMPSKNRSFFISFGMAFMICGWVISGLIGNAISDAATAKAINAAMTSGGYDAWLAARDSAVAAAGVSLPFIGPNVDFDHWRVGYFIGAIPIIWSIVLWKVMPETPHWFASKGRFDDVAAALGKLERSKYGTTEVTSKFTADQFLVPPKPEKVGPAALFSKKYIKGTLAIWIGYFCGTMIVMGMNAWLPKMMVTAGYSYGLATLNNGAAIITDVLAGIGAEKFGRKKNIIGGFIITIVMIILTTITFYIAVTTGAVPYAVIALVMVLFGFGINYGQTGLQPLMPEVYPASIRATGVSYCQAFGRFGGALGPLALGAIMDACVKANVGTAMSMSITFMFMVIPAIVPVISTAILIKGDFKGAIDELSETNE
ncbi:MAG: MFS transporter [Eggerthellaceae bacterium]|jgi:AAHS family 4-hydroxybenzoate transporter-like MFS transporter